MAGILDNKSRIMDVFVTELGRRQIAGTLGGGQLRVEYASFTDGETFYQADVVSGSADATDRVFFEATNRKQDFITFETDDSGILLGFEESPDLTILNDNIFMEDGSAPLSDFSAFTYVTGSRFASVAPNIMTASLDHFRDLRLIGSLDSDEPINRQFLLDRNSVSFTITNTSPWKAFTAAQREANLSDLEPMFVDKRLSNVINFRFLPPIIVEMDEIDPGPQRVQVLLQGLKSQNKWLGFFQPLGLITPMTFSDLLEDLNGELTPPTVQQGPTKKFDLSDVYGAARLYEPISLDPDYSDDPSLGFDVESGGITFNATAVLLDISQSKLGQISSQMLMINQDEKDWNFATDPVFGRHAWYQTSSRQYLDQSTSLTADQDRMAYPVPGTVPNVPRETVYFKETSSENNIVMQMFEINNNTETFKKLDVIDFGEITVGYDTERPVKHVFFIGKIFFNSIRVPSFVNLFTIILD